jgi:5-methylcytosine-specific restriction endonuclease McrA
MELVSRKEAIASGKSQYFTGKPCKHGHISARTLSSGVCISCATIRTRAWRKLNPERKKESSRQHYRDNESAYKEKARQWHNENRDRARELGVAWRKNNKDKCEEIHKAWIAANREKRMAVCRRYAAKRRKGVKEQLATMLEAEKLEIKMLYEEAALLGSDWHVDHIIPLSKGGEHRPYNMQIVKSNYNHWKRAQELYAPEDVGKYMPEHYKVAA